MFKNQIKNYNSTVWDITMNTSLAIVDFKLIKSLPTPPPGFILRPQAGFKV